MKKNLCKRIKRICDKVSSNGRQILEVLLLLIVAYIPWIVDLQDVFKDYLNNNPISPNDFFWQVAFRKGRILASVILLIFALIVIRNCNKDFVMNRKRVYHDYSYAWYCFCAKILGINSCDLVLVPIPMQFKLIIRATFAEYSLNEREYSIIEDEPNIKVDEYNVDKPNNIVNLILEDTYIIKKQQIPEKKRGYRTIFVSRNSGNDNSRHFSQKYIEAIINCVKGIKGKATINVFATTNPLNNFGILTKS